MTSKDVLNGILYLAKQSNYTMSHFEKKIGKSAGYISRTIKDNADVGFSTISRSAKELGFDNVSCFVKKLEQLSQDKNCPICKGLMQINNGQYVCKQCGAKIMYTKEQI